MTGWNSCPLCNHNSLYLSMSGTYIGCGDCDSYWVSVDNERGKIKLERFHINGIEIDRARDTTIINHKGKLLLNISKVLTMKEIKNYLLLL